MTLKDMVEMGLNERRPVGTGSAWLYRVPGGWIYDLSTYNAEQKETRGFVSVPLPPLVEVKRDVDYIVENA